MADEVGLDGAQEHHGARAEALVLADGHGRAGQGPPGVHRLDLNVERLVHGAAPGEHRVDGLHFLGRIDGRPGHDGLGQELALRRRRRLGRPRSSEPGSGPLRPVRGQGRPATPTALPLRLPSPGHGHAPDVVFAAPTLPSPSSRMGRTRRRSCHRRRADHQADGVRDGHADDVRASGRRRQGALECRDVGQGAQAVVEVGAGAAADELLADPGPQLRRAPCRRPAAALASAPGHSIQGSTWARAETVPIRPAPGSTVPVTVYSCMIVSLPSSSTWLSRKCRSIRCSPRPVGRRHQVEPPTAAHRVRRQVGHGVPRQRIVLPLEDRAPAGRAAPGASPCSRTWTIMVASWAHPAQMSPCAPKSGKGPAGRSLAGAARTWPAALAAGMLVERAAAVQGVARDEGGARQVIEEQVEQRAVLAVRAPGLTSRTISLTRDRNPGPTDAPEQSLAARERRATSDRQQLTGGADPGLQGRRRPPPRSCRRRWCAGRAPGRRRRRRRAGRRGAPCRCWWCGGWTRPALGVVATTGSCGPGRLGEELHQATGRSRRPGPGTGRAALAGRHHAVDDAHLHALRVGHQAPPAGRLVVDEAHPGRGDPVGVEQHEVGGQPGPHEPPVGEPEQPGLVTGEHGHGALEGEHLALAHPVLQGPHGVAAVGVGQHVGAGVGGADHGRRVGDQAGHLVVVAVAHDRRPPGSRSRRPGPGRAGGRPGRSPAPRRGPPRSFPSTPGWWE